MDTEKAWEDFKANDSSIKKSESVQQDIQQILDTVTQIKTDVDQLKAEGPQATGPADTEPSMSAPEEQQPSPEAAMGAPAPDMGGAPQAPMGDLEAQPEDGAATPGEPPAEPTMPEPLPAEPTGAEEPGPEDFFDAMENSGMGLEEQNDEDILLDAAKEIEDPELKQQLIALVYQALENKKAPPMPPIEEAAPVMEEEQLPPEEGDAMVNEAVAAAMDQNGDGMITPDEAESVMRSADNETVQCDADLTIGTGEVSKTPGGGSNPGSFTNSDEEEKKDDDEDEKEESDEKKDDDDKSERPKKEEPGVNDDLPESDEEDKDSLEDLPDVTEVKVESEEEIPESDGNIEEDPVGEEIEEAIESIIDSVLEDAKERIKEQVIEATAGIEGEHGPFMLSASEMMKSFREGGSHRAFRTEPIRKSIEWPDDVKSIPLEDKCRFFAKSFTQMDELSQDNVVSLMDMTLGPDRASAIFKSEGVDLDTYYEPIAKGSGQTPEVPSTHGETVSGNGVNTATDKGEGMVTTGEKMSCTESEMKSESVEESSESIQEGFIGNLKDNFTKKRLENKYQAAGPDKSLRLATSKGGYSMAPEGMNDKDRKKHMSLVNNGKDPHSGFEDRFVSASPQTNRAGGAFLSQKDYDSRKSSTVQSSADDTESLEACAKSATPEGVGIHIPTVNEMMQFKKSGTSMYTAMSREAAEPHGIVKMDDEPEIPSVKEMFAKRFGRK